MRLNFICYLIGLSLTTPLWSQTDVEQTEIDYYDSLTSLYKFESFGTSQSCKPEAASKPVSWDGLDHLPENVKENILYQYDRDKLNFAGCYKVIIWGCGTACQMLAVFDRRTGICIGTLNASMGFEFKLESRLIIANPPEDTAMDIDIRNQYGPPRFVELKDGKLLELSGK